ncbi:MAG: DUF2971 domain-containing protein, partial [Chloroflexota bacterium]|nr:DUF2971 domain-containing protein [Chloroflexota bacterium]
MAGTFGLLTSAELWATDVRFLNDEGEGRYGVGIAHEALEAARLNQPAEVDRFLQLIEDALQLATLGPKAGRRFAVSLSGNGDLLSQWRAYGGGGTGCALGFDTEVLATLHGLECRDVSYDSAEVKVEMAKRLAPVVKDVVATGVPADDERVHQAVVVAEELAAIALSAKHPAFADERELRVSVLGTSPLQRIRGDEVISYVPIAVSGLDAVKTIPSLTQIVLGPL